MPQQVGYRPERRCSATASTRTWWAWRVRVSTMDKTSGALVAAGLWAGVRTGS
ncbi:MAG TPA: hypothetical protein VFQ77_18770 [Pseudonocardiaceae bacterium]|jgi:hypothetical protein|nr:hypothetical protein [Pseudonocardiaceae bacterium]